MRHNDISRKAWQRAVNVLLWYQDNIEELASLQDAATTYDPEHRGSSGSRPLHPDPTANAAIRLVDSQRTKALKAEIEAVEEALCLLTPEQREVVRRRFWQDQWGSRRKPRQYDYLQDTGYSERQMKRICRTMIRRVAANLGER